MFETLDTLISLAVIFLILSMVNKYVVSLVKRLFKIKAKTIAKEMETFVGENTTKYLIPYLEKKAKYLNFLENVKGKNVLRKLNKNQLKGIVDELDEFLKDDNKDAINEVFGIDINVDKIAKKKIKEIKDHLGNLKGKIANMYDNTMEKMSEVNEKEIRYRALISGLALAFIINADFFGIYNSLSKAPAIHDKLVVQAEVIQAEMKKVSDKIKKYKEEGKKGKEIESIKREFETVKNLLGEVESAGIVLGWTKEKFFHLGVWSGIYKFIGLCIAGLLISFGAPFWHDFIGTFTGLRKTLRREKGNNEVTKSNKTSNPLVK